MNEINKLILLAMIFWSFSICSQEYEEQNESLHKVLIQSFERLKYSVFDGSEELNDISSWLAQVPSLQLSLLKSDHLLGSDEFEMSVNLPIKSNKHRRLDKMLLENSNNIKRNLVSLQKLYLSGLIRESTWNYALVNKKEEIEQKKNDWLLKQRDNLLKLINVGDTPAGSLLFIDKRLLDSNLKILELKSESTIKLLQYNKITGKKSIPHNPVEENIVDFSNLVNKHPKIQALQIAIEQSDLIYKESGNASAPWNVSLTAKDVNNQDFNDRQLGIQLEVPLSFVDKKSQSNKSVWLKEQTELSVELHNFHYTLSSQFDAVKREHIFLIKKQNILLEQKKLTSKILSRLNTLRSNNELEQDIFYQRMIELHDSMYQAELNQIYINQNKSRQNQLAGVSL